MTELYKNIKTLREQLGLSQEELAKRTGYTSRSSIAKIEKGLVDLSQTKIELFAKVLGVSPGDLMGWEQESNQAPEPTLDEQLEGVEFALWGEVQDLSDDEKQDILDFIKFKKSQRK